jgi:hypothetical protein
MQRIARCSWIRNSMETLLPQSALLHPCSSIAKRQLRRAEDVLTSSTCWEYVISHTNQWRGIAPRINARMCRDRLAFKNYLAEIRISSETSIIPIAILPAELKMCSHSARIAGIESTLIAKRANGVYCSSY